MLSDSDFIRHSRHVLLPICDEYGVLKFQKSRVAVIGLGGLGTIVAPYLAAAGVGFLRLIDDDTVNLSNLPRQWLYSDHLGALKVTAAARELKIIGPQTLIEARKVRFSHDNATALLGDVDLVLDCSDNLPTRHLINRICHQLGLNLVTAAAIQTQAQCMAVRPHAATVESEGCYRCLYPFQTIERGACTSQGVLAPIVGMAASLQASLALQILANEEAVKWSMLWRMDSFSFQQQCIRVPADPECPVCQTAANVVHLP